MAEPFEVAEDQRLAITRREPADLLVDHRSDFAEVAVLVPAVRPPDGEALDDAAPLFPGLGLPGDPERDPVQPSGEGFAVDDRPAPAEQDQERGLEGVLGRVSIAQDAAADGQDHRPVSMDQDSEGPLAPGLAGEEVRHELPVGPRPHRPQEEE